MSSTQSTFAPVASAGSDSAPSSSIIPASMQRRHPASLIPRYMHDPVLLSLLKAPLNDELISYVAERTLAVVATPSDPAQLPTPPTTPIKSSFRRSLSRKLKEAAPDALSSESTSTEPTNETNKSNVPSLATFIKLTAARSNAQAPTLLMTLVYLDRLRQRLKGAKAAKGMQCTYHRLFLACLIAAAKYCNDCCPRNVHWVKWSGLFTLNEVNLMEQELLMLLDHELRVDEKDLILICAPFLPASSVERVTNMDRNIPSLTSCATSRTSSSEGVDQIHTPESSPIAIQIELAPDTNFVPMVERKKTKLVEAANSTATVITRAKSWYGNLRASAA
ncbi:uncharacterized protein MELLADRAFT_115361 [Melampsora larici-populina 98AG31]|uniref:Cyclin N-terminal domain-containing protein n=1 Tax=Melampsora larici-populina (strain 98AG31 / pathotype 3-4-7) TaxID=747676 RepID=F4R9H7_MELLP|nr:uncharacterized protein MELLADRAFT_115361 [Melampsora larici-populina 98AG31]EGG11150.1 hypothetical protein MELLADRAFT_115361 [Melampsora larici-populina 98AG31]